MSLWAKIGLPDREMVASLREEICALREEHKRLMAENTQLLADCIRRESSESAENVSAKIDAENMLQHESLRELQQKFSELKQSQSVALSQAGTLLEQLKSSLNEAVGKAENEVLTLREESKNLIINQARLITDCVQEENVKSTEAVKQKINAENTLQHESLCELQQKLSELKQSQSVALSQAGTLLERLKSSLNEAVGKAENEVLTLREESKNLIINQARLITDCVQEENVKSTEAVKQKIDAENASQHELLRELQQKFSELSQSQTEALPEMRTILEELQNNLRTATEEAKQGNSQIKELDENILNAVNTQKVLFESSQVQDRLNEIPEIRNFVSQLWEAMKLVWINDILNLM